jgi:acyl-CoA dehydrogenase
MQLSVLLLALAALLATVAAFKLKLWQFILLVACGLLALGFTGLLARPLASALLLLFLIVMLPLSIPQLRRTLLTGRLFAWFKRMLPPLSQTEQIAIDAGTVWWDRDLFTGDPDWEKLLKVPAPTLSPEEQSFIDWPTEKLFAICRRRSGSSSRKINFSA